jgi:hypothetical protein
MSFSGDENTAYGPAYKPLVGSWISPDRWSLSMFRYSWPYIRSIVSMLTVGLEISRGRAAVVILLDFFAVLFSSIQMDGFSGLSLLDGSIIL